MASRNRDHQHGEVTVYRWECKRTAGDVPRRVLLPKNVRTDSAAKVANTDVQSHPHGTFILTRQIVAQPAHRLSQ